MNTQRPVLFVEADPSAQSKALRLRSHIGPQIGHLTGDLDPESRCLAHSSDYRQPDEPPVRVTGDL